MDDKKQRVFARHPLHYIANITYYEDTYGKHMIALRLAQPPQAQPQGPGTNELVIYECTDEVSTCRFLGTCKNVKGGYPHLALSEYCDAHTVEWKGSRINACNIEKLGKGLNLAMINL